MRWSCFAICLGLTLELPARAGFGWVQTVDGANLSGELQLSNNVLIVTSTNPAPSLVGITNLRAARFDAPGETSGIASGGHGHGLLGYYFSNTNLHGDVGVRLDETIDFDWAATEPPPGVAGDHFSIVWTGELEAPATGDFTFFIEAGDRGRLYLASQLVAEAGEHREAAQAAGSPVALEAGKKYPLKFLDFDSSAQAQARLCWSGPGVPKSIVPRGRLDARGMGPDHLANITTNRGLLATYYHGSEFGGATFTRIDPVVDFNWSDQDPAPGIARTNFSVRWSGQLKADYSEEYTLYTLTDEPVRVWVEDKLLIDRSEQTWLAESKESLALVAGEKYRLRLETRSTSGGAVAKLIWSSASTPKATIPPTHLSPSRPTPTRQPSSESSDKTPPGVVLRSGAFIAGAVEKASETSIRLSGLLKQNPITTVNVARILCQPLSPAMAARLVPGRTGVLLAKGDFVDGEFRGLDRGRVEISSVLFGRHSYDAKREVLAVALRPAIPTAAPYEIQLRDRSILQGSSISLELDALVIHDSILGAVRVPASELAAIQRHAPAPSGK